MAMTGVGMGFGLDIAGFGLALTLAINGVATDVKDCGGFLNRHVIKVDGFHDFAPEVVALGFRHET
ncbi:hypothetical protein XM38_005670 [Halomicronema hongdechloris C2206]|uniref:Uncharacterized protein n=1 Tax=Halomicronema hongdechloris C2206 TaxID=1641165 RepID=A0A1Z3HHA4_9CYAN|nr:hypothetical protein XM38_005670 [Halomicronema hongdechloris C2206]